MALATLTARVDEKDKARFDTFCTNVGLNTSTAINLFVKAVLRENRIPFEIAQTTDPFFSETNMAYVKKSVQELKAGKGTAHDLIERREVNCPFAQKSREDIYKDLETAHQQIAAGEYQDAGEFLAEVRKEYGI